MTRATVLILALWMSGMTLVKSAVANDDFVVLDNGLGIRAAIAPEHGAELTSLSVHFDGRWHELLYRAMDYSGRPGWRGKAPLLWPATGVSIHPDAGIQHYALNGELYEMPFHGFVRNVPWRVIEEPSADKPVTLVLAMCETTETRRYYPFAFDLKVEYRLRKDRLSIQYTVTADVINTEAMPFSIGNHITFNAPLIPGSEAGKLKFYNQLPEMLLRDINKAFSGQVVPSPFTGWHNVATLGRSNAVSLGGQPGKAELLVLDPSGFQLRLAHQATTEPSEPAIRFNLWADTEDGFFSPEPWLGTQNSLNSRAGLVKLHPGETWNWTIDIVPSWIRHGKITDEDSE